MVSRLLPFGDQHGAYHMVVGRDVEEKGFSPFESDEDWADVRDALRLSRAC